MEPENIEAEGRLAPLQKVTPVSKYLAMALFIIMPFIAGWIGYTYAPEKVVEVEKLVVAPAPEVEPVAPHTIVHQLMWFWNVTVDSMNKFTVGTFSESFSAPSFTLNAPEGWWVSQSASSQPYTKTIRFVDPDHPGRPDTDVPIAHAGFVFPKDTEACTDTHAFKDGSSKMSPALSGDQFDVYDTGWSDGWAGLPSRVLCFDAHSEYGEIIEMSLYPITKENQQMFETMLAEMAFTGPVE